MASSQRADIHIKALGAELKITNVEEVHGHMSKGSSGHTIKSGETYHMTFQGNNFSFYGCEIKLEVSIDSICSFSCHFWSAYSGPNSFTIDKSKVTENYEVIIEQEGNYTDQSALGTVALRVKRIK